MAYRRKIIDRRTREGRALGQKLDALRGFGTLAVIGFFIYFVFGNKHSIQSTSQQSDSVPFIPGKSRVAAVDSGTLAVGSPPLQAKAPGTDRVPARQAVPWRHVTATGVRWSLRRVNATSMLLIIDLGEDQVANITVAPAFEDLDLAGINDRIDHLRSTIAQSNKPQTSNYIYDRDGALRPLP